MLVSHTTGPKYKRKINLLLRVVKPLLKQTSDSHLHAAVSTTA